MRVDMVGTWFSFVPPAHYAHKKAKERGIWLWVGGKEDGYGVFAIEKGAGLGMELRILKGLRKINKYYIWLWIIFNWFWIEMKKLSLTSPKIAITDKVIVRLMEGVYFFCDKSIFFRFINHKSHFCFSMFTERRINIQIKWGGKSCYCVKKVSIHKKRTIDRHYHHHLQYVMYWNFSKRKISKNLSTRQQTTLSSLSSL